VHGDSPSVEATDWSQVLALYDRLYAIAPTAVVGLNRAIALAEVAGPVDALAVVDRLDLDTYYLGHATRADLLGRLGRGSESREAYDEAIARTSNDAERALLARRRDAHA